MIYSVPANLLIAGEYAVTVAGGLGLAAAIAPRAYARIEWTDQNEGAFRVHQRGGTTDGSYWPTRANPLLMGLWNAYRAELPAGTRLNPCDHPPQSTPMSRGHLPPALVATIEIDTRSFFDAVDGRKLGLGSSAAAAVLFIAALDTLRGDAPDVHTPRARAIFCNRVVRLYRQARGGRGSGYDIAASVHGGVGIYQARPRPRWMRLAAPDPTVRWGMTICSWSAGAPVDSGAAIGAFERWCAGDARGAARFRRRSNRLVRALARSRDGGTTAALWRDAAELGQELGDQIGVNARIVAGIPPMLRNAPLKASGAGDERAIALLATGTHLPPGGYAITIESTGITVEG